MYVDECIYFTPYYNRALSIVPIEAGLRTVCKAPSHRRCRSWDPPSAKTLMDSPTLSCRLCTSTTACLLSSRYSELAASLSQICLQQTDNHTHSHIPTYVRRYTHKHIKRGQTHTADSVCIQLENPTNAYKALVVVYGSSRHCVKFLR